MIHRFNAIAGGRRSAKTFYALIWLLIGGLSGPVAGVNLWLSPTIKQARSVGFNGFMSNLSGFPEGMYDAKRGALTVTIAGRQFMFSSTDNADSIRGPMYNRVVFDEAAFQNEYAWTNVVRPALADTHGPALFTSTFDGFNWFYDIMQSEAWNRVTWPTAMNPLITGDELIEMRELMDEQTYKQEILAEPTTAKGLVYERVFGSESIVDDCGPRPGDTQAISIDFGYNDPTAISFYTFKQITRSRFDVIKFDEMEFRNTLIEAIIPEIVKRCREHKINPVNLIAAVDIAGKQHTGVSEWSYIDRLKAKNIFKVVYKKTEKLSSINFLRAQFLNANNDRSFKICKRCKKTVQSYTAYEIKDKERPFDDSKNDHFPDSDIYFFENVIRPQIGFESRLDRTKKKQGPPDMVNCTDCYKRFITFTKQVRCLDCQQLFILKV